MSRTAITVENLGKEYVIGGRENGHETFREMIVSAASAPFRRLRRLSGNAAPEEERIWALKAVTFEVKEGEVVGIIGRNGAGKSTLLKILSRITEPTEGRAEIRGLVSSLLEVGTGFHPELTGRENIYLNGAILGMSRVEIDRKFDSIIDFSGVEKFIDTPVKHYSSGMKVRLAFAVAAHLEPEILIVDEVLAVGDAEFQRKCLGKMSEVASIGRTVLFVSHNMAAVRALCSRALVLFEGSQTFDGSPDQAIDTYFRQSGAGESVQSEWVWSKGSGPGGLELELRRFRISGERSPGPIFQPAEAIDLHLEYEQWQAITGMQFVLQLQTCTGEIAFTTTDQGFREPTTYGKGRYEVTCTIPGGLLNRIDYVITLWAGIPGKGYLIKPFPVGRFSMEGVGNEMGTQNQASWPGVICPKIAWRISSSAPVHA